MYIYKIQNFFKEEHFKIIIVQKISSFQALQEHLDWTKCTLSPFSQSSLRSIIALISWVFNAWEFEDYLVGKLFLKLRMILL